METIWHWAWVVPAVIAAIGLAVAAGLGRRAAEEAAGLRHDLAQVLRLRDELAVVGRLMDETATHMRALTGPRT